MQSDYCERGEVRGLAVDVSLESLCRLQLELPFVQGHGVNPARTTSAVESLAPISFMCSP